jgi:hypothetical protein
MKIDQSLKGLYRYQMIREYDFDPLLHEIHDGGHNSSNLSIISDYIFVVQWHIEINSHQHMLTFQLRFIQILNIFLFHHLLLFHAHHATTMTKMSKLRCCCSQEMFFLLMLLHNATTTIPTPHSRNLGTVCQHG